MFWNAFRFISDTDKVRNAVWTQADDMVIEIDMQLGRYGPEISASIVEANEVAAFEQLSDLIGAWLLLPHPEERHPNDIDKVVRSDYGQLTCEAGCRCISAMMRTGMPPYPLQDSSPFGFQD